MTKKNARPIGSAQLPIWRDANRLLLEIERAVHASMRYHKYTIGSELRMLAIRLCRLLSRAITTADEKRLYYVQQLLDTVGDLKISIQLAKELKVLAGFQKQSWHKQQERDKMIGRNHLVSVLLFCLGIAANSSAQTCNSNVEIPPTTPTSRFADNGDGTVTDGSTRLMWAKCPEGLSGTACTTGAAAPYTWEGALNLAEGKILAGYSDWRLPNLKELQSIIERQCLSPAINLAVFPNTPSSGFWSASPVGGNSYGAWDVYFDGGGANFGVGRAYGMFVRLVRSGQ